MKLTSTGWDRRAEWRARAEALHPELKRWTVFPVALVEPEYCEQAWQKCQMRETAPGNSLNEREFTTGEAFTIDFGESLVGRIRLRIRPVGRNDSPLRLTLTAAELPYEAAADFSGYHGSLSRAWLQDETVNIDVLPGVYELPRRYSLRYLKIKVVAAAGRVVFDEIAVVAEAAERELPKPPAGLTPERAAIHQVALRTLRNCMQSEMEDGPKRDRRLWLGDLRLQALADAVGFRRFDLIERSLLLLAAGTDDDGRVPGCIYTKPELRHGNDVVDYALLFIPTLDDLVCETGNLELAKSLYPLAARQVELFRPNMSEDDLVRYDAPGWIFIDWATFDRQTAMQGVLIYSLKALARLADRLELPADAAAYRAEAERYSVALRRLRYDRSRNLVLSGAEDEVSYAGQVWPILAGVFSPEEARAILMAVELVPTAQRPVTPYMHHHLVEAFRFAGMTEKADAWIDAYWGAMVRYGADTFWEVFVPGDDFLSPYHDALINSACHAWSCTPVCFLSEA